MSELSELVGKYPSDEVVLRDYILELESKLAKAINALEWYRDCLKPEELGFIARQALEEIK